MSHERTGGDGHHGQQFHTLAGQQQKGHMQEDRHADIHIEHHAGTYLVVIALAHIMDDARQSEEDEQTPHGQQPHSGQQRESIPVENPEPECQHMVGHAHHIAHTCLPCHPAPVRREQSHDASPKPLPREGAHQKGQTEVEEQGEGNHDRRQKAACTQEEKAVKDEQHGIPVLITAEQQSHARCQAERTHGRSAQSIEEGHGSSQKQPKALTET